MLPETVLLHPQFRVTAPQPNGLGERPPVYSDLHPRRFPQSRSGRLSASSACLQPVSSKSPAPTWRCAPAAGRWLPVPSISPILVLSYNVANSPCRPSHNDYGQRDLLNCKLHSYLTSVFFPKSTIWKNSM